MRLVYLSPLPWGSFAQRPHKFVQWFHDRTGGAAIWVEPYPTRFARLGDLRHLRTPPVPDLPAETPPWLTVLRPGGLPIEPLPGSGGINRHLWQRTFGAIANSAGASETLLAIGKPSVLALLLLRQMRYVASLYDAMDDFPQFYTGFSRLALAQREKWIARQVDILWASSTGIWNHWNRLRDDVRLVHNGLDHSLFPPIPEEHPEAPGRKVLGYAGTIAAWFDWEWVCALACSRPKDEIRLIGPIFERPTQKLPDNIRLLPPCSHDMVLKAMMDFDAGLIPFKKNKLTDSVDPIKYYEYMALAVPVLSTDFGEMRFRADIPGVFISRSSSDVTEQADSALRFHGNTGDAQAFALKNSWKSRFDGAGIL